MAKRVLIVDDDALVRQSLSIRLQHAGYLPEVAASGEQAVALMQANRPDLVLLDISMPGMDGLETLRAFQRHQRDIPVIFVTAHRRELDEIVGLELGADDYITKPFDMDVLLAHIKAVLRRAAANRGTVTGNTIVVGDLRIDPSAHTVHVGERPVDLTLKEYGLLFALAQNPGHVLSADELLSQVWGAEWIGETQTLYVHIHWLREKVEEDPANPRQLVTVRGVGYKLLPTT